MDHADRCEDTAEAVKPRSATCRLPRSLDLTGLKTAQRNLEKLLTIDKEAWEKEMDAHEEFFETFGNSLPDEMKHELAEPRARFRDMSTASDSDVSRTGSGDQYYVSKCGSCFASSSLCPGSRYAALRSIAAKRQAGHFVILRPLADSERIPLTIVTSPIRQQEPLDIIFQVVGATTRDLAALSEW